MPLTAVSNHSASRADSTLFVELTRELLQQGCNVRFRAGGTSMHPTIRDGEVVTVAPRSADRVVPGDVILYRCDRGPTAHRVVAVQPSPDRRPVLHLRGDNLCAIDGPIQADAVIGRVVSVSRDGRDHLVDGPGRLQRAGRMAARLVTRSRRFLRIAALAALASVVAASAAAQSEVLTGTYVGNGVDNRQITGLGFTPAVVIVKAANTSQAVGRTSTMAGDVSKQMGNGAIINDAIQSLNATGFTVGTSNTVNSNAITYQWVAWKAFAGEMVVGTYTGNGTAPRSITGLPFSPNIVFVWANATAVPVYKNSSMLPTYSYDFDGAFADNTWITALGANGFTVGNTAPVNSSGVTYHYVAWDEIPGKIDVGTYDGNGAAIRNISGLGFQPDFVMVQSTLPADPVAHSSGMGPSTNVSHFFGATANTTNAIRLLQPTGFQVGTVVNAALGVSYRYQAWGRAAPTAVRMAGMSAHRTDEGVVVEWRTGYEVDNLGFHVYRGRDNGRVRLSTSPLAGSGLLVSPGTEMGAGHSYRWSDDSADARAPDVEYWVEDIDLNGTRTWHGPIRPETADLRAGAPGRRRSRSVAELTGNSSAPSESVESAAASAATSAAPSSRRPETTVTAVSSAPPSSMPVQGSARVGVAALASAEPLQTQWSIAARAALKIDIASSGWYRVTQPELVAASLAVPIDPDSLQLFVDGVEQPLRVNSAAGGTFGSGDSVEFHATGADTPYSGIRTYWLVSGDSAGQRIPEVDGQTESVVGPSSFPSRVEWKPRSIFFAALMNGDQENFFGPLIIPGEPTTQVIDLPDVIAPVPADAEIEVALQGVSEVDHRVGVRVNGIDVGEVTFTGRDPGVGRFAIPQAYLIDGANAVSLEAREGETDHTLVDYIRVFYHRRYRARANRLTFSADAGQQVAVAGFTNAAIRVIDITGDIGSHEVLGTVSPDGAGWRVALVVPGTGPRTLLAVATGAEASPVALRANVPSTLHQAGQAGDIIMIAPAAFQAALEPLAAFRAGQGYAVQRVDIEDVYDEFSFGSKTPQAIKDFLVHATAEWSRPPRFLLLVGNATQDPRDYLGLGELDHVPTKVVQSGFLEAASDDWFVDPDDDGFADLASVGRLPARSDAQVAAMVSKIIGYEQSAGGDWQRSVLLVSDQDSTGDVDFPALNDLAREEVPATHRITHIRRGIDPDAGAEVKARLSEGAGLVTYQGHGSVASWRLDLLTTADVPGLTNGSRLPIVVALTCFNGLFQSLFPEESLAEALVRAPNGGAVGVWASSGITSPQWQWRMNVELYRQIFQGGWSTIGEAMRAAKQIVGDPDVRRTWIYFGDPVTRFAGLAVTPTPSTEGGTTPDPQNPEAPTPSQPETPTPAAPSVQRVGVGLVDFDGDGRDDPFLADARSGSLFSAFGPIELTPEPNGRLVAGEPMAVDLNGDGSRDLFVYDASTGEWLQAMNLNDGRFIPYTGSWGPGYRLSTGDFDGDGREEVFGMSGETGAWFQALPDGLGGFTYRLGIGLHDGEVRVADFDADSHDDVFVYETSTGRWTLMLSNAEGPTFERGNWGVGWDVTTAHLHDDRKASLVLWHGASGVWSACIRDDAASLVCSSGLLPAGGRVQPLDRDGDGRDELLRYDAGTGGWTLIGISPSGEATKDEGVWEPGWSVASGDLDGDGRDDVALYNSETGVLIKRLSRGPEWQDEVAETWPAGRVMIGRRP